jgi:hypothetical protein
MEKNIDFCPHFFSIRRGAGVVERDGLENRLPACSVRGFESLPLRIYPPKL